VTTVSSPKPEPLAGVSRLFAGLKRSYSLIQALGVLAILIVAMQIANDRFLSPSNVGNLLGQMTIMLIVAAGMTIVMIAGELDVSVGSVVGLSAAVAGWERPRSTMSTAGPDHGASRDEGWSSSQLQRVVCVAPRMRRSRATAQDS